MFWEIRRGIRSGCDSNIKKPLNHVMRSLYNVNNDEFGENDKSSKVRRVFDKINANFQKLIPHSEVEGVDESMISWFVGYGCKEFIKGKHIRYDYKVFMGTSSGGCCFWVHS